MIFQTTHFGAIAIAESSAVEFREGLPGFEHCRRFALLQSGASPGLVFLQSLDRPQLCFITVPVRTLWPEYELALSPEEIELIGMEAGRAPLMGTDVAALAIISFTEGQEPTANLLAPIVIHLVTRLAVQAVRLDGRYQVREGLPATEPACS